MAIDASVAFINTDAVAFPNTESVNATGPSATDGTEFVKVMIDNYMFGPQQALLDHASLTPDGSEEEAGASQELEAMQKLFGHPGESVDWYGQADPATLGMRVLLLSGQGVLVASYPELTTAVYVGDPNNGSATAFYRADDAGGSVRNVAGIYLILADARGLFKRALDLTGTVDPLGASRITGDTQDDQFQGHWHNITAQTAGAQTGVQTSGSLAPFTGSTLAPNAFTIITDGTNGTPRIGTETRSKNISVQAAIRY